MATHLCEAARHLQGFAHLPAEHNIISWVTKYDGFDICIEIQIERCSDETYFSFQFYGLEGACRSQTLSLL